MKENGHSLSDAGSPVLLLLKQTALRQKWGSLVDFKPSGSGDEAGIVVWLSRHTYCTLGIHNDEGLTGIVGARVLSMTRPDLGNPGKMKREVVQVRYSSIEADVISFAFDLRNNCG
jgi:Beta xylosidase C-terminal Concanavalin A-like domain